MYLSIAQSIAKPTAWAHRIQPAFGQICRAQQNIHVEQAREVRIQCQLNARVRF